MGTTCLSSGLFLTHKTRCSEMSRGPRMKLFVWLVLLIVEQVTLRSSCWRGLCFMTRPLSLLIFPPLEGRPGMCLRLWAVSLHRSPECLPAATSFCFKTTGFCFKTTSFRFKTVTSPSQPALPSSRPSYHHHPPSPPPPKSPLSPSHHGVGRSGWSMGSCVLECSSLGGSGG